jgi:hypothetical protein
MANDAAVTVRIFIIDHPQVRSGVSAALRKKMP